MQETLDFLTRGCVDIISAGDLKAKLEKGKTLRVKLGADPTSADLHLGHSVVFNKLRQFQDKGHIAVLVIGDFTASIGDPSGRNSTRPMLSMDEILQNAKTYTDQAFKILDKEKTEVRFNSSWLQPFVGKDLLKTLAKITVAQTLERDDFKKRMAAREPVSMLEVMYSIFQGQDSVALEIDVELGGTDQIFNLIMGRHMQKQQGMEGQVVLTMPLLVGTDGVKKMSKSYGNYIGLSEPAKEIYGKIMSVSDELMYSYYELLTSEDMKTVREMHPMQAKKNLAALMVTRFYNTDEAAKAAEGFASVFSKKENPDDMKEVKVEGGTAWSALLAEQGLAKSKNDARRLIDQGGLKLNGEKIAKDGPAEFESGAVLQCGKRHFIKLIK